MYPDFIKRALVITVIVVAVGGLLIWVLPGDRSENALLVGLLILALLVAGVVIYLIFLPGMYQKKLEEKKGGKDLRRFVMSDPRFKSVPAGQKATPPQAAPKPGPVKAQEEQKASEPTAAPPEDDDNPFLE